MQINIYNRFYKLNDNIAFFFQNFQIFEMESYIDQNYDAL